MNSALGVINITAIATTLLFLEFGGLQKVLELMVKKHCFQCADNS